MKGNVLVVEDEQAIADLVRAYLVRDGYEVTWVRTGEAGLEELGRRPVRLVVLDIGLPGIDGFEVCRRLRARTSVPILILSARDDEVDRVAGLEAGADDYVVKPFSPREVAARVNTVLRRARAGRPPRERVSVGPLELDAAAREARREGELLSLTAKEFDLLWFLASNAGRVFSRDQLMHRVWGYSSALDTGTVTVHIRRLREKLERDPSRPELLTTVWGVGYRIDA
ncbi:MAG: response regulator transcription factor [Gaiellaceae bacterium]